MGMREGLKKTEAENMYFYVFNAKIWLKTYIVQISEAQYIPNRKNAKKITPGHIITKQLKPKDK